MSDLYETYRIIFAVFLVLSILMLITSVLLFIKFDIIKLFGDLTGRNAKKEIESIMKKETKGNAKVFSTGQINRMSGISGDFTQNRRKVQHTEEVVANPTEEMPKQSREVSHSYVQETSVLNQDYASTTVLSAKELPKPQYHFFVETDIMLIHTSEVIE